MSKLLTLGLKSPGNWAILIASSAAVVQQVRPCLTGNAALLADAFLAVIASGGVIWNTLHLHEVSMPSV